MLSHRITRIQSQHVCAPSGRRYRLGTITDRAVALLRRRHRGPGSAALLVKLLVEDEVGRRASWVQLGEEDRRFLLQRLIERHAYLYGIPTLGGAIPSILERPGADQDETAAAFIRSYCESEEIIAEQLVLAAVSGGA